jgi:hypothetical protein
VNRLCGPQRRSWSRGKETSTLPGIDPIRPASTSVSTDWSTSARTYSYTHARAVNSDLMLLISGVLTCAYCVRDAIAHTLMWPDDRVLFLGRSRDFFLCHLVETAMGPNKSPV